MSLPKKHREVLSFGLVGVVGYFADVLVTMTLAGFLGVYVARIPAFIAAATTTWVLNRKYTFKNNPSSRGLLIEYLHYLATMTLGLITNYLTYALVVGLLGGGVRIVPIAVAVGSLAGMAVNFVGAKKLIYKEKKD